MLNGPVSIARVLLLLVVLTSLLLSADPAVVHAAELKAQENGSDGSPLKLEPLPFYRMELASEALALWRRYASQKPALLLLSDEPMLTRVPAEVEDKVFQLAATAVHDDLLTLSDYARPLHLFLPNMTLDIALRQAWFSKLFWAYPVKDASQAINRDALVTQLETAKLINEKESSSLTATGNSVSGVLRDVPATMAPLQKLGKIDGPVLVHLDQSYFQGLYENEIATPLLQLVAETLAALHEQKLEILAVTYSLGNLDSRVSLQVRFLQEIVPAMIVDPSLLEQPWPLNWQRQRQIMYLDNFFRKEETRKLALEMDAESPDSAWVKYALYHSSVEHKLAAEALATLAEAVARDQVYALEYMHLAEIAYEKGRPDEAMRMLSLAGQAFPENVQIKLNMARIASDMGEIDAALHLVEQLQGLQWSQAYYMAMPEYLEGFAAFLRQAKASAASPADESSSAGETRRKRILK